LFLNSIRIDADNKIIGDIVHSSINNKSIVVSSQLKFIVDNTIDRTSTIESIQSVSGKNIDVQITQKDDYS
jgi:hypothetical protein